MRDTFMWGTAPLMASVNARQALPNTALENDQRSAWSPANKFLLELIRDASE